MPLVWCLIYLAVIGLMGCAVTCVILRSERRPISEFVALVLLLGTGTVGMLLLWLSLLGVRPNRMEIVALGVIAILILLNGRKIFSLPRLPRWEPNWAHDLLVLLPILALLAANIGCGIISVGFPLYEWDSFAIWGFKAKVLYAAALSSRPPYFTDVRLAFTHLAYPLLFPMLTAGAYATMGQVNDQLGKIILPILFAGQTLLAYTGARLWLGRLGALVATMLLICAPFNIEFSGTGNADMALATFDLGAIVYLLYWMRTAKPRDLIFCTIFTIFAAMTKSEGLPLAMLTVTIVVLVACAQGHWKTAAWAGLIMATGILPWLLWSASVPHVDEDYLSRLTAANVSNNISRLGTILPALTANLSNIQMWGGLWLLVPLLALLGFKALANPQAWALWGLLLAHLVIYLLIFIITPWSLAELLPVTVPRLMLHLAPNAMLVLSMHWASITERLAGESPLPTSTLPSVY